jgi:hypothetical protein
MAVPAAQLHFVQMRLATGMSITAQDVCAQHARQLSEFAIRQLLQRRRIEGSNVAVAASKGHRTYRHADLALSRICMTAV